MVVGDINQIYKAVAELAFVLASIEHKALLAKCRAGITHAEPLGCALLQLHAIADVGLQIDLYLATLLREVEGLAISDIDNTLLDSAISIVEVDSLHKHLATTIAHDNSHGGVLQDSLRHLHSDITCSNAILDLVVAYIGA